MDITFQTSEGRFNHRVCAVIVRGGRLLVMRDGACPYAYLPGGRVRLHETAEHALIRELREEMGLEAQILRPLWLCQAYFIEEVSGERYHEAGLYYLVDLPAPASNFSFIEEGHANRFEWVPFNDLKDRYLYPEFIKERIFRLPEHLEILVENRIP